MDPPASQCCPFHTAVFPTVYDTVLAVQLTPLFVEVTRAFVPWPAATIRFGVRIRFVWIRVLLNVVVPRVPFN